MDLKRLNDNVVFGQKARERMQRSGMTCNGHFLWTEEEDEILRKNYPNFALIRTLLPKRPLEGTLSRCRKLNLTKKRRPWLGTELAKLRRVYLNESRLSLLAMFPGRSWNSIKKTAQYYGLNRNVPRYTRRRTDDPRMDAVLARLEEIGWSLRDLDGACGTRYYFKKHFWRKAGPNYKVLLRAIHELDGELVVVWKKYDD